MLLLTSLALAASRAEIVERTIDASPEAVWAVLTDFDAYADWNPWIFDATGEAVEGTDVTVLSRLGDAEKRGVHAVTAVSPTERLCWEDTGWFTVLAKGQRCRTLTATGEGTVLRVELTLSGPMTGAVERRYGEAIRAGMQAEIDALARRAASY